jgi:hypothetical protein
VCGCMCRGVRCINCYVLFGIYIVVCLLGKHVHQSLCSCCICYKSGVLGFQVSQGISFVCVLWHRHVF